MNGQPGGVLLIPEGWLERRWLGLSNNAYNLLHAAFRTICESSCVGCFVFVVANPLPGCRSPASTGGDRRAAGAADLLPAA